ncbi:PREDICTED: ribosomal large subunit pseudouridine synthase C-like [Dufourea novaeangliae]|uniref:RNA pseudouridylate synthase domain-containing protein 3 n=1 Tax=Dufourea novaeangliae TaxID=178035 RepID=A0A154PI10_DUFNO|nr:PREDICTED: ribosomal large subunit pseudouridine synthase C-like [Dufourea novaeangliae]KZC10958.1 RNA pseudouridylate synthase domain-containing protein 3 [Dufourea novaeangliae]
MENLATKLGSFVRICKPGINAFYTKAFKTDYTQHATQKCSKRDIHPYKRIHPWKSLREFSEDLVNNVIYNSDGLIALNKPYGIGTEKGAVQTKYAVPNAVDYTLQDALPHIAEHLKYPKLTVVRNPEKYMSGVTLLAGDSQVQDKIEKSLRRGNNFTKTYLVITTSVPKRLKGKEKLAMEMISNPDYNYRKPVIVSSWSERARKRQLIKPLSVDFKVLSNSTLNLCSLIEMRSSTIQWHAIRLFATTVLYCPVLGDNMYASRIQKIGNTYVQVDPFLEYTQLPPVLEKPILQLLNVKRSQQHIIPVHIHLKSIDLPSFIRKGEDLKIEAPLIPPFDWTCEQLEFKCLMKNK